MDKGFNQDRILALKEWAVALKALQEGKQTLLMRKGGIREETRDFQLESRFFYLFPTYEHQRAELVKAAYQPWVETTRQVWEDNPAVVTLTLFAEVIEDIEIMDLAALQRLQSYHIWTDEFAEVRLHWKRTKPLHLLLLRIYKLKDPIELPMEPAFIGCKSWIDLHSQLEIIQEGSDVTTATLFSPLDHGVPVLTDVEFRIQVERIKHAIQTEITF